MVREPGPHFNSGWRSRSEERFPADLHFPKLDPLEPFQRLGNRRTPRPVGQTNALPSLPHPALDLQRQHAGEHVRAEPLPQSPRQDILRYVILGGE